jgi:ferritin-like metal-binding protein YciE
MTRAARHCIAIAAFLILASAVLADPAEGTGSLETAQFPDVIEFDFEKVTESYEAAGENVGKVSPILEKAVERGQAAVDAGTRAQDNPTDENKRRFVAAVLDFVRGAEDGKARIAGLQEDVRGIHSQTGMLYEQARAKTATRLEELRKEYEREEVKYEDLKTRHKKQRRDEDLTDWELRKIYGEEKRQAQALNRLADRIQFQQDFQKALEKAQNQSAKDFTLYEQYFAEASDCLGSISNLASNVPLVAKRLQLVAAIQKNVGSRKAAAAGFENIEQARELVRTIGKQLNELSAGGMGFGDGEGDSEVIIRHTRTYKSWLEGGEIEYRRPPKTTD